MLPSEEQTYRQEASALVRSVKEKIMILPDDTKIYPGHMEETSVQFEKEHNPFIYKDRKDSEEEWRIK